MPRGKEHVGLVIEAETVAAADTPGKPRPVEGIAFHVRVHRSREPVNGKRFVSNPRLQDAIVAGKWKHGALVGTIDVLIDRKKKTIETTGYRPLGEGARLARLASTGIEKDVDAAIRSELNDRVGGLHKYAVSAKLVPSNRAKKALAEQGRRAHQPRPRLPWLKRIFGRRR